MQVELSTVLSGVGTIVTVLLGGYITLLKYTIDTKEKDYERRLSELTKTCDENERRTSLLMSSLVEEEKRAISATGKVATLEREFEHIREKIDDMRKEADGFLRRADFEGRMSWFEKALTQLLPNRTQSTSAFQAVRPPEKR